MTIGAYIVLAIVFLILAIWTWGCWTHDPFGDL